MKEKTLEVKYDECIANGNIIPLQKIDKEKILSLINKTTKDLETIKEISKNKDISPEFIYKANYEAIHFLATCVLLLDRVKSLNHECLFAYLCIKHPELELDWGFFQKIRTKRNSITYYLESITRDEWRQSEAQFKIYNSTLKNHILENLEEH
jgi:hypothetical protein